MPQHILLYLIALMSLSGFGCAGLIDHGEYVVPSDVYRAGSAMLAREHPDAVVLKEFPEMVDSKDGWDLTYATMSGPIALHVTRQFARDYKYGRE